MEVVLKDLLKGFLRRWNFSVYLSYVDAALFVLAHEVYEDQDAYGHP